jgi:myosin heavy subunit
MKDIRSLLLILLSSSLILTWAYHLYDKAGYSVKTRDVYIKDSVAVAEAVSDSLRKIFTRSLDQLGMEKLSIDSANTSLKTELSVRISEINKLKAEVNGILQRKNLTQSDLAEARSKIKELQEMMETVRLENSSLTDERKRLGDILADLNTEMNSLQQNIQKVKAENTELNRKINEASTFMASEIKFTAVNIRSDQKEAETNQVKRADKMVASFTVQNNINDFENAEVVILIRQPSGSILNTEVWDAGSFETRNEGRKGFTRKMKFEYKKGESKKLIFSIQPEYFEKGSYEFLVYHNGVRIGQSSWKLN